MSKAVGERGSVLRRGACKVPNLPAIPMEPKPAPPPVVVAEAPPESGLVERVRSVTPAVQRVIGKVRGVGVVSALAAVVLWAVLFGQMAWPLWNQSPVAFFFLVVLLLPALARAIGKVKTHMVGLACGALGYLSFLFIADRQMLYVSEILVGIAWASILAMPYAILASNLPQRKLGIYMGLFNVFIVVPQLMVATLMGQVLKSFFPDEPIWTMLFAAIVMGLAALSMLRIREGEETVAA